MTQYFDNMYFSKLNKRINKSLVCLLCLGLTPSLQASEQEWWFDVEVILFDRQLLPDQVKENFEPQPLTKKSKVDHDLLSAYLTPDLTYIQAGLPYCRASRRLLEQQKHEEQFAFPEPAPEPSETAVIESTSEPQNNSDVIGPSDPLTTDESLADSALLGQSQPDPSQFEPTPIENLGNSEIKPSKEAQEDPTFEYKVVSESVFDDENTPAQINNNAVDNTGLALENDINEPSVVSDSLVSDNLTSDSLAKVISEQELNLNDSAEFVEDLPETKQLSAEALEFYLNFEPIEWQIPSALPCAYAEQIDPILSLEPFETSQLRLQDIEQMPVVIDGIEWTNKKQPMLLPKRIFRMVDLYNQVKKQKDLTPLAYLSWRQEVKFGSENAAVYRLFAGQNYANRFNSLGQAIVEKNEDDSNKHIDQAYLPLEEKNKMSEQEFQDWLLAATEKAATETHHKPLVDQIFGALQTNSSVSYSIPVNPLTSTQQDQLGEQLTELWQIEGGVKVYLEYVGRVPYLHIDSELDYRRPITAPNSVNIASETQLQGVKFKQLRRIISKQIHYFDHPLFGMIVRLHRYQWPEVDTPDPQQD